MLKWKAEKPQNKTITCRYKIKIDFFTPTNPIQTYIYVDVFVNKLHKKTANAFVNLYMYTIYMHSLWNK